MTPANRLRILAVLDALQATIEETRGQVVAEDRRAAVARYAGPGSTREKAHRLARELKAANVDNPVAVIAKRLGKTKRHVRRLLNEPAPAKESPVSFFG